MRLPWRLRDHPSWSLLFAGLFCVFLSSWPANKFESIFSQSAYFFRPLFLLLGTLQPSISKSDTPKQEVPDAKLLAEKEGNYAAPSDPNLLARRAFFASIAKKDLRARELTLAAGFQEGLREGMEAVWRNEFVGTLVSVEAHRSVLRLPSHPLSRVGLEASGIPMIGIGSRAGRIRVELPGQRRLPAGEAVYIRSSGQGLARLGSLVEDNSKHASFWVRPFLDLSIIQGVWLLSEMANANVASMITTPIPPAQPARRLSDDLDPQHLAVLLDIAGLSSVSVGDAVISHGKLAGRVDRVNAKTAWVRGIGDRGLEIEQILIADDGSVISLGRSSFYRIDDTRLGWISPSEKLREGWLFTAASDDRIPKGILIGRVKADSSRFILEGGAQLEELELLSEQKP